MFESIYSEKEECYAILLKAEKEANNIILFFLNEK